MCVFCSQVFSGNLDFLLQSYRTSTDGAPLGLTGNSKLEVDESGAGFLFVYDKLVTCPECHLALDLIQLEWILSQHPPQTISDG